MLAENGLGKYNLVISDFLFLTVGFIRPSGFKTLRQELSDALQFMRRSAPLNYEPCSYVNSLSNKKRAPFWVLFFY